jgi:hypothetical protein
MRHSLRVASCLLAVIMGADLAAAAVRTDVRQVALQGQPAPVANGDGANFATFQRAMINNQGDVAFTATIDVLSGNAAHDTGVWATDAGVLANRVRAGQPAPGANPDGSTLFTSFNDATLNDAGAVAFHGSTNQSPYYSGYWVSSPAATVPIAVVGTPLIGFDAEYIAINYEPALNGQGQIASNLSIRSTASSSWRSGIFVNDAATVDPVALEGEPAPGTTGTFARIFRTYPPINDSSETAFAIEVVGPGAGQSSTAIYAGKSQTLRLLARSGMPAPGTDAQFASFTFYSKPQLPINANGDTMFNLPLEGNDVTAANDQGLWRTRGENLELIARKGDVALPATEGAAAAVFNSFSGLVDDTDQVVFSAGLAGDDITTANATTLWSAREDVVSLIMRTADPAPGTPDVFTSLSGYATNRLGQVAFGASAGGKAGIWAQDPAGYLRLVIRVGDQLEISPGEFREIAALGSAAFASIAHSTGSDGRSRSINDRGEIVFNATLSDGRTGVFVSDAVTHYAADFDGNGAVDAADLLEWQAASAGNGSADADGDGETSGADFLIWQRQLGRSLAPAAQTAVPEPTSFTLATALSAFAALAPKRRTAWVPLLACSAVRTGYTARTAGQTRRGAH